MDTGLLYRAVALNLLRWGGDPESEFAAPRACDFSQIDFADPELKSEAVGGIASRISAYPLVRAALLERQRDFAGAGRRRRPRRPRHRHGDRARGRRQAVRHRHAPRCAPGAASTSSSGMGLDVHYRRRPRSTSAPATSATASRAAAPLVMAEDAVLLDTSELEADEAVAAAIAAVERRLADDKIRSPWLVEGRLLIFSWEKEWLGKLSER